MEPAVLEPGTLLGGRFRLGKRLERDWRGDLFLAQDEREGGAPCEVELIRTSGKQEEQLHRLVEREVEISELWLKDVPDVLRARAWGLLGPGEVYVARELLPEGKPLEPSGDLDAKVWQVLSAVQLVAGFHQRGIVHRDLGPRALIQGPQDGLRLARFALARLEEVAEPWAGPLGLPLLHLRCASPEVFLRPSEAGKPSDVYALGALLFRAVVGRWPYAGPSLAQLVQQQQQVLHRSALPPTEGVNAPSGLRRVCARALALDPAERFQTAEELAEALETWLSVGSAGSGPDDPESDLGALDLTGNEGQGAPPSQRLRGTPGDLAVIETSEDEALEHSAMTGSDEEWVLPPEPPAPLPRAVAAEPPPPPSPVLSTPPPAPPPLSDTPRPAATRAATPAAMRRPPAASTTPGAMRRAVPAPRAATPGALRRPAPAPAPAELLDLEDDEAVVVIADDGAPDEAGDEAPAAPSIESEPLTDQGTLRPVAEACPWCEEVSEGVLLMPGSPKELDSRVRALRRADLSSLRGLLVDLRWVSQLGGAELEALAALQGLAERRGIAAGLLGANKAVRHILTLMDMGSQVPRLLGSSDPEEAATELLGSEA